MSGENSYFSRFFVKFVEVSAAGLATAISAYALAHFGGLLSSSPTPASAPAQTAIQVGPTASEVAGSRGAQRTRPAAAAAVNKQSPAPQQDTDAPVDQPARKAVKDAKALPPRKHTKTDTSVAEKEPRGQKSAEALARAALANVDANRPAPNDALIEPGLADTRSAPVDVQPHRANMPPRQADVGPQPVAVPPRALPALPADVQPRTVETSPAIGADLQPRSPDVRPSPVAPVDMQPRPPKAGGSRPPDPSLLRFLLFSGRVAVHQHLASGQACLGRPLKMRRCQRRRCPPLAPPPANIGSKDAPLSGEWVGETTCQV